MDENLRKFLVLAAQGGGKNFRPVAGLATSDGRKVAEGRIFRSGFLREMNPELRRRLADLEIRTVVTLQTTPELEILGDPVREVLPAADWQHIAIGDRWFQPGGTLGHELEAMGDFYLRMVVEHGEEWARFFRLFTRRERYAVLYHCTAGRDRTGVATALLLETLGADRGAILQDYLISNQHFGDYSQPEDVLEPLFRAIDAAGGIEKFLVRLGVASLEIEAARENLLV